MCIIHLRKLALIINQNSPGLMHVLLDDLEIQFCLETLKIGSLNKFTFFVVVGHTHEMAAILNFQGYAFIFFKKHTLFSKNEK